MFRNISAFKNKDIKVLIENFAWLSILQIASYVFPFITLPYLSRVIGVEKFGEIAFANAIMAYLTVIIDWGFLFSAVRDIAKVRDNKEEVSNIYSTIMWSRLILLLVSFIILVFVTFFIDKLNEINRTNKKKDRTDRDDTRRAHGILFFRQKRKTAMPLTHRISPFCIFSR